MDSLGDRLRFLRERERKTQDEIAAILGTTQQIYSRYETGKIDLPLRHLLTLVQYYNISADYLLGRTPCPQIPPELSGSLTQSVTIGDFVCRITSFNKNSKRRLVEFVNYLAYLENTSGDKKSSPKIPSKTSEASKKTSWGVKIRG